MGGILFGADESIISSSVDLVLARKENILLHGVPSLIGDFLGISPALLELSKSYNVFLDTKSRIDGLIELLPAKNIGRIKKTIDHKNHQVFHVKIHKHYHLYLMEIHQKATKRKWYMTQAFMDSLGLKVPSIPPKLSLSFPYIPTPTYDFLISPFARSLPPQGKWPREKWQQLINRFKNKKFALLGDSLKDDKKYLTGDNLDVVFDLPFDKLCNLFKNCGALVSVVTGTSHLAFHLGVKNILLCQQPSAWGINPEAFNIQKKISFISVDEVSSLMLRVAAKNVNLKIL